MISKLKTTTCLGLVFLLSACTGAKQSQPAEDTQPVTHEQLRIAFRASFLNACEKGVPGQVGIKYCSCADDKLESAYSDAELAKITPQDPKFRAVTHVCAKKFGLKVQPGH